MKNIVLSNGFEIPQLGLGTYKLKNEEEVYNIINEAVNFGYTMIDTAHFYDNEEYIGKTIKSMDRKKLKIATKVWPTDFGYDNTMKSIERSLKLLSTDYIDVMYIHWPGDDMQESWRAFEKMYDEKVIKNLAVANFLPQHYEKLMKKANVKPVLNQIEMHPYKQEDYLQEYYKKEDIKIVSWSPIAKADKNLINEEIIQKLSKKYGKTPIQIILRWHIEKGFLIIPKTSKKERLAENIGIFDFELEKIEMQEIQKINKNQSVSKTPHDDNWLHQIRYEK